MSHIQNFLGPQSHVFMSCFISFQPVQSARGPAAALDLQELPFTPVHAPIMASAPGMHKLVRFFLELHIYQTCITLVQGKLSLLSIVLLSLFYFHLQPF